VSGALGTFVRVAVVNGFVLQRIKPVPTNQNRDDLLALTGLIEDGKLMPVLGRVYPLADTAEGLRHVEQGQARRKVIIAVSPAP
jgi:NADPH:quinone reductase-like Zn-dependent oxidoreductase